ncbi:jg9640 [Pararge aegeria aegeria]|uniref:Jg9640 protein n=1 Tax=Pararge aegeria aegeria TaxID=348720 RepID=A0A8S4RZ86_9NEOP|nr:jg9640 [Pararge aegeria aegeria]
MLTTLSVLFLVIFKQCDGVIYYLNETEYSRLPPIYHVDNYTECLRRPDDVYCTVNFDLVSDERSELLELIQEYSERRVTHFNHSKIRHSVCVTHNCQPYIRNKTAVTAELLEGCLNDTFWKDYNLKTKVENHYCHTLSDNNLEVDASDIVVALVLLAILLLNMIGSINDIKCTSKSKEERSLLSCFSVSRNWKNLIKHTEHKDPRLQRLKGINFWRCIISVGVIMVHCIWPFLIALNNPYAVEMNFYDLSQHIIISGSIALQAYLVISGFLLAYKMELHSEQKRLNWRMVPKGLLMRYLRLTPVYAVTIAVMATWIKFAGAGPFWEVSGDVERSHCRSRWWASLLYINNYFYNAQCVVVGWYLGVDMQMFVLGIITCVALRNQRHRAAVLATLFILGMTILGVHIYVRDLYPILIMEPHETRSLFESDPNFNEVYKMGHNNIVSYVVGMALGYLVYRLQQLDIDINKYKKYRFIYWALLPMLIVIILSGRMFYRDGPKEPIYVRVIYGVLVKPIFAVSVAGILCGTIFKLDGVYRRVFEWRIWTTPARLSYCVYIIHMPFLRLFLSLRTTLLTLSSLNQLLLLFGVTAISFIAAVPLWLLVEAPFVELTKYWSSRQSTEATEKPVDYTNGTQEKIEMNTNL